MFFQTEIECFDLQSKDIVLPLDPRVMVQGSTLSTMLGLRLERVDR